MVEVEFKTREMVFFTYYTDHFINKGWINE